MSLYGLPHFYALRSDVLTFPSWTYLYDTHPLLPTLASHIDFAALNASDTAFVITAVDVESGVLKRFSNQKLDKTEYTTIEPHHVLASGSLPPQFPWTDIKDGKEVRHYWDGGIVDNTPLSDAIDAFSPDHDVKRMLVVMNLFPPRRSFPLRFSKSPSAWTSSASAIACTRTPRRPTESTTDQYDRQAGQARSWQASRRTCQ